MTSNGLVGYWVALWKWETKNIKWRVLVVYGCACHPCQVLVVSMYRFKNCPQRSQTPFFHPTKVSECVDALFIWQRNTGKSKRVNMTSVSSALSGRFLCNIDFRAPHRFFCHSQKVIQWRGQSSIRHGWSERPAAPEGKVKFPYGTRGKLKFGKNEVSQWENSWSSWENGVGSAPLQPCPQGA